MGRWSGGGRGYLSGVLIRRVLGGALWVGIRRGPLPSLRLPLEAVLNRIALICYNEVLRRLHHYAGAVISFKMPKITDEELNGAAAALLGLHTRNSRWAREEQRAHLPRELRARVRVYVLVLDDDAGRKSTQSAAASERSGSARSDFFFSYLFSQSYSVVV